jgi:iron complex outermembrane receptor protein
MRQSASLAALLCCACVSTSEAQTTPQATVGTEEGPYPVVITPARLRQSLADVPASVSIITGEMLRQYGIRSVAEALRLVPGMAVTHSSGPEYRINYHGTNMLSPRRMNVLIDGISVYRPAFSEVIWTQLPVVVEDIDRIEVTRGPNSAAYGPNSMLAVINIITRNPRDVDRAFGAVTLGSQSTSELTARAAITFWDSSASLTASRSRNSGYDELAQDPSGHDGLSRSMVALRSETRLSPEQTLSLRAAVVDGTAEVPFADDFQVTYPDRHFRDWYVGGTWSAQVSPQQELRLRFDHADQRERQSWRTCAPTFVLLPQLFDLWRANPVYAETIVAGSIPSGGSATDDALAAAALLALQAVGPRALAPSCVTANQDASQWRTDLEVQSTYVATDRFRFVVGGGLRHQGGESETFLGGTLSSRLRWIFGNIELRPRNWLTLNAGGYYEHNSQSPETFSPRLAANFHFDPSQTVRMVLSKGSRSPDIQEQRTNWSYTFTDTTPPLNGSPVTRFYQSRVGPGNLVSERITSAELGYLVNIQSRGMLIDVKLFRDELTSLISERTNLAGATPTNDGAVTLRGAELQATWALTPSASAFLNYAHLDNVGASKPLERSQYSRHSGSVGLSQDLGNGWRGSLGYFGASGNGLAESSYGRLDLTVTKLGQVNGKAWTTTLGLRRLDNPFTSYAHGQASRLFGRFDSRLQGFVQLSLRLP